MGYKMDTIRPWNIDLPSTSQWSKFQHSTKLNSIFIQYQIVITNIINVDKEKLQYDK